MADDASGNDGDDSSPREASPTDSDVQHSDGEQGQNPGYWDATDRDDRSDHDEQLGTADDIGYDDPDADGSDNDYRVPLDLSEDSEMDVEDGETDDADDADEDDPYAPEPSSTRIQPGDPALENIIFVFLGAIVMILILFRFASILL